MTQTMIAGLQNVAGTLNYVFCCWCFISKNVFILH